MPQQTEPVALTVYKQTIDELQKQNAPRSRLVEYTNGYIAGIDDGMAEYMRMPDPKPTGYLWLVRITTCLAIEQYATRKLGIARPELKPRWSL